MSTISAVLCLIALALSPLIYAKMTKKYLALIKEKGSAEASDHRTLFEDYKADARSLRYVVIFLLRRYLMILVLTILPGYAQVQIMC